MVSLYAIIRFRTYLGEMCWFMLLLRSSKPTSVSLSNVPDIARDGLVLHMYELPDEPASPETLKDLSSKITQKWWAILDSNQ